MSAHRGPVGSLFPEHSLELGFRPEDAAYVRHLAEQAHRHPAAVAAVALLADRLRARIGRVSDRTDPTADGTLDVDIPGPPGNGIPAELTELHRLPLLALLTVADDVLAEYRRRGIPRAIALASLADLGRQVALCRMVHGRPGLHTAGWVARGFTGGTLRVGRLAYTLEPCPWAPSSHVLGVHIPEDGPLTPEAVDESFTAAVPLARSAYPEADIVALTCVSWLLDPGWSDRLGPDSRIVRFARRFQPYGEPFDGRRDSLYFGFHVETAGGDMPDLSTFPRGTALHRAILDRFPGDDPPLVVSGRIPLSDMESQPDASGPRADSGADAGADVEAGEDDIPPLPPLFMY